MNHEPPLDADLLVAYAEGRLDDERRAVVEERLARDDEARRMVALLVREGEAAGAERPTAPAPAGARRGRTVFAWAAAAVLLIGVGAVTVRLLEREPAQESGVWLQAMAKKVAAEAPEDVDLRLFTPLSARELEGGAEAPLRGGLVVTRPRAGLAGDRPEFHWVPVAGVEGYDVTVLLDDGTPLWTKRATAPPFPYPADAPPLPRGRQVVVEVAGQAPLGRVEGRVTTRAARPDEEASHLRSVARIRAAAEDDREDLLVAHFALRKGRILEAEAAARAYLAKAPDDPLARATLAHVERRLGLSR